MKRKTLLMQVAFIIGIFIFVFSTKVFALSIPMSISKTSANVGDSFSITISGINGRVDVSASGPITLNEKGSMWIDGSKTISGKCTGAGTGKVSVSPHSDKSVTTTSAEADFVTGSNSKSITITEKVQATPAKEETKATPTQAPTTKKTTTTTTTKTTTKTNNNEETKTVEEPVKEDNFYISSITIKGITDQDEKLDIKLSPEFNKDTFEYTCNVPSNVQKLDIKPDAGDYTNSVMITGANELVEGENKVTLLLGAEDHESKQYIIKVIKEAKQEEDKQEEVVETKEDKPIMVSMPLLNFILLQVGIILIEIGIIALVIRLRNKNK